MYKEDTGKYYYIINGKRKYVKVPEGVSSKNLARINIQNIIKLPSAQRIKRQGKLRQPKFGKKIASSLQKDQQSGLPLFVFKPGKKIKTLEDLAKESDDTSVAKLTKLLLKGIEAVPSSSKVQPTIVSGRPRPVIEGESKTSDSSEGLQVEIKRGKGQPSNVAGRPIGSQTTQITPMRLAELVYEKHKKIYPSFEEVDNIIPIGVKSTGSQFILTREMYEQGKKRFNKKVTEESKRTAKTRQPSPVGSVASRISSFFGRRSRVTQSAESTDTITDTEVEGGGYDGSGLYNDEIEKIAKKRIKDYVPVIASDQLNELPKYVARGDKRFGFVVNTNPSTSDGSGNDSYPPGHWTTVFINNEDDYPSIEFFDPLAQGKMPEDLIKMCRRIAVKMNPEVMFKYKQNMLRRQSKMTSNCGFHAVKYLDDRYNGVPFSEATGYDDYMESLNNAPDGSRDGEKEIASYIKKYESYI
jgi:hypothetical protein